MGLSSTLGGWILGVLFFLIKIHLEDKVFGTLTQPYALDWMAEMFVWQWQLLEGAIV